MTYAIQNKQN